MHQPAVEHHSTHRVWRPEGYDYKDRFYISVCSLRYSESYNPHPEALQYNKSHYVDSSRACCPIEYYRWS